MEDLEQKDDNSKNWLERMHPFLQWKIICPECTNPFGQPMSNKVLIEFATRKEALLRHVELKGTVDGEEIITLKNITRDIEVITNHPAVTSMKKTQIKAYIESSGVLAKVERDILSAQQRYLQELKSRKVPIPTAGS